MKKTKIEWCDYTWNPVSGCRGGCAYCYARKIAERFSGGLHGEGGVNVIDQPYFSPGGNAAFPFGFEPTLYKYKLGEPAGIKTPQNIFVCSMADLFGEWVPDEWILSVFAACRNAPQHRYLFLTKNPAGYERLAASGLLPRLDNFWYGTTVEKGSQMGEAFRFDRYNTFVSMEPLLGCPSIHPEDYTGIRWLIVGAETGSRRDKIVPEEDWVSYAVGLARDNDARIFLKDSLLPVIGEENMIKEFPWEEANERR